jgi:hypothetical protein
MRRGEIIFRSGAQYLSNGQWGAIAKYNQLKQTSTEALSGLKRCAAPDNQLQLTGTYISVPLLRVRYALVDNPVS